MSVQDLGGIGEWVAALATIATLIYLAIQINQNTRAMRATSTREILFKLAEFHQMNVSNPDMMRCFKKSLQNPMPDFTVDEWSEMNSYIKTVFHIFEAAYVQGRFGVGTGDTNEPHLRAAATIVTICPVWKKFWEEEAATGHWTEGFINYIEQMSPGNLAFVESDGSENDP
ncbi:MAG: hypothetical protein ACI9ON_003581 [Limisphaerales bacterium]|jgi:hypothetical protein